MKEALAHALSGPVSLAEDEWRERPVDRLHALAMAQSSRANRTAKDSYLSGLGVSIIAAKHANRADEIARAIERLSICLRWSRPKPDDAMADRLARQAIHEHLIDFCPTCKGTGEIPVQDALDGAQPMKICPECGGHGRRKYTDRERIEALQIERAQYLACERWMASAFRYISLAESEAIRNAKKLLERW